MLNVEDECAIDARGTIAKKMFVNKNDCVIDVILCKHAPACPMTVGMCYALEEEKNSINDTISIIFLKLFPNIQGTIFFKTLVT